ncbi:hypothetical protein D9V41_04500 [Aeromicrobium phragmitis]|uniref:Cobalamin biosynthesis protein CbiX n=1 Tax=Aeromicrobium phragmitis TaxID=2478914 RepID=A0A3L8PNM5_9ACTN|nr:hypothetical protein [Aeromicrobium phragmitis]RLV57026.1 hypothetical protein D9V41_04500 [Aeromicrobium phragmitis]
MHAVRRETREFDVVDGFIDLQQPDVADVVRQTQGRRIIVPLTLWHDDATARQVHGLAATATEVTVTAAIGPDWVLAELAVRRLIEAGARPTDTIVLAGGPADSERAVRDIGKAARLLSAVWGGRVHVGTTDGGLGSPLSEAIDIARAYQRRVVVSMYALTMPSTVRGIGDLGADVVTGPLLSPGSADPTVVSLILARAAARGSWLPVGRDPARGA